ncbi:hypothetical protein [Haliea sp. E17]|uniref:hypothetical protein n=1 Tax=Haliea sp. E17 TaxID=3401576 RepID=UPI003AADF3A3
METVPDSCAALTELLARNLLGQEVKSTAATEHLPTFSSACEYSGNGPGGHKVNFTFKFMMQEMFDVAVLPQEQLDFNVMFATGGVPASEKLADPGLVSYVIQDRDRTTLLMLPGISGPDEVLGAPSVLVATFQLKNSDLGPERRRDLLLEEARKLAREWGAA